MEIVLKDLENDDDILKFHDLLIEFYHEIGHELKPGLELQKQITDFRERGMIKLAVQDDNIIGLICIGEFSSIYAGGKFGILNELYVIPQYRSKGVGKKLMSFAYKIKEEKGWTRLEVSTPDETQWKRTLTFYLKEGFVQTGLKMKNEVPPDSFKNPDGKKLTDLPRIP